MNAVYRLLANWRAVGVHEASFSEWLLSRSIAVKQKVFHRWVCFESLMYMLRD